MQTCSIASGLANDPGLQTRSAADPGRRLTGQAAVTIGSGLDAVDGGALDDPQRSVEARERLAEAMAGTVGGGPGLEGRQLDEVAIVGQRWGHR